MPAKSIHQTIDEFIKPLQDAVSCVSLDVVRHRGEHEIDQPCAIWVGDDGTIKLKGPKPPLLLNIKLNYEIIHHPTQSGFYKIKTTSYIYSIRENDGNEKVRFDWHPQIDADNIPYPHMHMHSSGTSLHDLHFPTSRITLEQVLRLLISQYGVKARPGKNWRSILRKGIQGIERYASWRIEP